MLKSSFAAACNAVFLIHQEGLVYNLNNLFLLRMSKASYCLIPTSVIISFVALNLHCSSPSPICFSNESYIDEAIPGTIQSNYNPLLGKKKKKKEGEGKETWEKVQSNSVTPKSKKEIVMMYSIEKMKVIYSFCR